MSEISREVQKEKFQFKPTDAIITFGRGIEQVNTSSAVLGEREQVWKGTRLIQELVRDRETGRHIRTGLRKAGKPLQSFAETDELNEMAAGANANIFAVLEWIKLAEKNNSLPKQIIFSGGRPKYLDKAEPGITEASVMSSEFQRRLKLTHKNKNLNLPPALVLTESKNTQDDLVNSLTEAKNQGCKSVTIVNVSWAMERTKAFYQNDVLKHYPQLVDIKVNFVTSDELLLSRFGQRAERILADLKSSFAHTDTLKNEAIGIKKIIEGQYKNKGNY